MSKSGVAVQAGAQSAQPPGYFGENPGRVVSSVFRTRSGLCCGALLWRDVIVIRKRFMVGNPGGAPRFCPVVSEAVVGPL